MKMKKLLIGCMTLSAAVVLLTMAVTSRKIL